MCEKELHFLNFDLSSPSPHGMLSVFGLLAGRRSCADAYKNNATDPFAPLASLPIAPGAVVSMLHWAENGWAAISWHLETTATNLYFKLSSRHCLTDAHNCRKASPLFVKQIISVSQNEFWCLYSFTVVPGADPELAGEAATCIFILYLPFLTKN